jgi:hypothetical protein
MPRAGPIVFVALAALGVVTSGGAAQAAAGPHSSDSTIVLTSGPTWQSWSQGHLIGKAQNVCLNQTSPPNCPAGATIYGYGVTSWQADLARIPGATWIWAPGVTGGTKHASGASYRFRQRVTIRGHIASGIAFVAADDLARFKINGTWVGRWGSVSNFSKAARAHARLKHVDITPFLTRGVNRLSVWVKNGPNWFGGCSPCSYAENPAGVVFGFRIRIRNSAGA